MTAPRRRSFRFSLTTMFLDQEIAMPCRLLLIAALACAAVNIPTGTIAESPKPTVDEWPKEIANGIGMKLVRIPAGKFTMGSTKQEQDDTIEALEKNYGAKASDAERAYYRAEGPQHAAEITRPFWLGMHEVTQGEFEKVMGYNPSYFSRHGEGKADVKYDVKPAGARTRRRRTRAATPWRTSLGTRRRSFARN